MAESSADYQGLAGLAALQTPTSFSLLKGAATSSLTTILAIFLSIFVTEDYTSDTIKNVYSKGHSRDRVFFAKCISAFAASIIMILVCDQPR